MCLSHSQSLKCKTVKHYAFAVIVMLKAEYYPNHITFEMHFNFCVEITCYLKVN